MKKFLLSLMVALAVSVGAPTGASAQPFTDTLTAANAGSCTGTTTACAFFGAQKQAGLGIQITGTFVGTVQFEQTIDGTTWVSLSMTPYNSSTTVTSATAPGLWTGAVTNNKIRVRCSAYTSGSIVVTKISTEAFKGGSSGGGGGAPADATFITQTPDATLTNEQALSTLATGIVRSATTTGVVTTLTDSAGIAANISDETGTGVMVFGTSPTIVTPTIASFTNATHDHSNAAGGGALAFARTVAGGTVTTSQPWLMTQTWNNAAVTFEGLVVDATTTALATGYPLRIKRNGSEVFSVRYDGFTSTQFLGVAGNIQAGTMQILAGGYTQYSNGADFDAGFARTGAAMKSLGAAAAGFSEFQAQDFRLIPNGAVQPTCDATVRGTLWYTSSGAGVPDKMEVCAKSTLDVYAWRSMATIP